MLAGSWLQVPSHFLVHAPGYGWLFGAGPNILSTFIPKAEVRYLKNFSPAAIWQLFSYDIDNVSFLSVFVICVLCGHAPDPVYSAHIPLGKHSIREAWEQPTRGLHLFHFYLSLCREDLSIIFDVHNFKSTKHFLLALWAPVYF